MEGTHLFDNCEDLGTTPNDPLQNTCFLAFMLISGDLLQGPHPFSVLPIPAPVCGTVAPHRLAHSECVLVRLPLLIPSSHRVRQEIRSGGCSFHLIEAYWLDITFYCLDSTSHFLHSATLANCYTPTEELQKAGFAGKAACRSGCPAGFTPD